MRTSRLLVGSAALLVTVVGLAWASDPDKKADPKSKPAERFDMVVREDIFAGLAGDKDALARGMKACDEALAKDPKNAEALVWHGTGLMQQARDKFAANDFKNGLPLFQKSLAELDEAVKLAPENLGVRVPRAAVYLGASRGVPDEKTKKDLLGKAGDDLNFLLKAHKDDLAEISSHRRGEILMGLAEVSRRTGDEDKAKEYLTQLTKADKGTKYEKVANEWLKDRKKMSHNCIGCHTGK